MDKDEPPWSDRPDGAWSKRRFACAHCEPLARGVALNLADAVARRWSDLVVAQDFPFPRPLPGPLFDLPFDVFEPLPRPRPHFDPDPLPQPEPEPPLVELRIRLHVIATTRRYEIDGPRFARLMPLLNQIYGPSAIQFDFDPDMDFEIVDDFLLDQDFAVPDPEVDAQPRGPGQDGAPPRTDGARFGAARQERARRHHGKLVVYVSRGTEWSWDSASMRWVLGDRGFHFSGTAIEYVMTAARYWRPRAVTPEPGQLAEVMAHEIGHFLHLPHTFAAIPVNVAEAAEMIRRGVDEYGTPADEALRVFDSDAPWITDTPADAGTTLIEQANSTGGACGPAGHVDVPVTFRDGRTRIYRIEPDRENPMSYFIGCTPLLRFSRGQVRRMRLALEHGNRQHLLTGRASYAPETPVTVRADLAPAVIVVDHTRSPWFLPWAGAQAGSMQPRQWLGGHLRGLSVVQGSGGVLHLAARDFDNRIVVQDYQAPSASSLQWRVLGRLKFKGAPVVVLRGGWVDHFAVAESGELCWSSSEPGRASLGWVGIGQGFAGPVRACAHGPSRLDVLAQRTNRKLDGASWNGSFWTNWTELGEPRHGQFELLPVGGGRLELLAIGSQGSDIYRRTLTTAGSRTAWEITGSGYTDMNVVALGSPGEFALVARDSLGELWVRRWQAGTNGIAPGPWRRRGGETHGQPSAAKAIDAQGRTVIHLHARTWDGDLLQAVDDDPAAAGALAWTRVVCPAIS